MSELLIGCGRARQKVMCIPGSRAQWNDLLTLDSDPSHKPDVVHDLDVLPYPFGSEQFDEIHAYDVLEHVGRQGDWRFFFWQWSEFHRILKEGGHFFGIVPHPTSPWAWGDPSHTRVIPVEQLGFLSQRFYEQIGETAASDFRSVWKGNFELAHKSLTSDLRQAFVLTKVPFDA